MDYRFTAILIIMITLLALFGGPAHSKNEYLNDKEILIIITVIIVQTNNNI